MWPLTLTFCLCRTDSRSFCVHQPFEQIGYPFEQPRLSVQKNCHPFERLGLPLRTVRTACQLRYCSKTISPEQFATNLSENVHNSSKRCLPSPHVLSRYIFYSIHLFFFFITVDYRCRFYSKLSFSNKSCFGLFVCKYQTILVVWFLPWEYTLTGNDNILVQRVYFPLPSTVLAH